MRQHDDRRRQRPRAGHRAGAQDGLRVGHERRAGPAHLRQEGRADLPRPRDRAAPGLQRGHGAQDRPRGQAHRHGQLQARAGHCSSEHQAALDEIADELLVREVLDADQVRRIVAGKPLDERDAAAAPPCRRSTSAAPAARRSGRRSFRRLPPQAAAAGVSAGSVAPTSVFTVTPLPGRSCARPRRAHARHGHPQRHARFVRRRRPLSRCRHAPSTSRWPWRGRRRHHRRRRRVDPPRRRRRSRGRGAARASLPVVAALARQRQRPDLDRHLQGGGGRGGPRRAAPRSSTTSAACRWIPDWRGRRGRAGRRSC